MVAFSPAAYLRGLGWGGPGEGLNDSPNARAKALTVPMKKTLSGGKQLLTSILLKV